MITLSLVDSNNIGADVSDTQSLTYYTNVNYELQVIEPTTVGQIRIVTIKVSSPLGACSVLCAVLVVLSLGPVLCAVLVVLSLGSVLCAVLVVLSLGPVLCAVLVVLSLGPVLCACCLIS
jgi:hypothetical protein